MNIVDFDEISDAVQTAKGIDWAFLQYENGLMQHYAMGPGVKKGQNFRVVISNGHTCTEASGKDLRAVVHTAFKTLGISLSDRLTRLVGAPVV